ncbi:hypothetical protein N9924_00145 [bacterium]|nr:hypothetical protein [bacterium]
MNFKNKEDQEYVDVADRVQLFHKEYKNHSILTNVIQLNKYNDSKNMFALVQCQIQNPERIVIATGHAMEVEGSNDINKTSYLENAETSAVGRALGFLGIGSSKSIASKEEVKQAVTSQEKIQKKETVVKGKELTKDAKKDLKEIDLSFIPALKDGKRTDAALKRLNKGLIMIGITKQVAMLIFNRYDEDGTWKSIANFYTTAPVDKVEEFIAKVREN